MPYYRSSYNRYGRRWPYRSWRGSYVSSAQRNGTRRFNVSVPIQDVFSMTVANTSFWTPLYAVAPYYRALSSTADTRLTKGALVTSPLYQTYAALYDEVKINSVSVTLSIMTAVGIGGVVPALKVYSSWDRDASYAEVVYGQGAPTVDQLMNGSESQVTLITNTSSSNVKRFNRASDLMEKIKFHDCTVSKTAARVVDSLYGSDSGNAQLGYCPCMFFAINTASAPGEGQEYSFNVSVEVKWNVTFRNPKYGLSASANRLGDVKSDVVESVEEEKSDEMEDEKPILKKKKVVVVEEEDEDDELLNPIEDESQEPFTAPKPVLAKKAGKKS